MSTVKVGDIVRIHAWRRGPAPTGRVIDVQDAPRKMTGGRGVVIDLGARGVASGWDPEDLTPAG
jgi:hypothetical protein